jgi:hypothetical protein
MSRGGGQQRRVRNRLHRSGEIFTHCTWCGEVIYWLHMIPRDSIIKIGATNVTVNINGHRKALLYVTVDHYFELRNGGTNELRNLVPSCARCNRDRSAEPKSRPNVCQQCGGKKTGSYRRSCKACVDRLRPLYVGTDNHGTKEVRHQDSMGRD